MNVRSRSAGDSPGSNRSFLGIQAASVGLAEHLDVEVLLVAEVVVDRRQVRPGPVADRPHPRQLEPLLGKLLAGRLKQPRLSSDLVPPCHLAIEANNRFKQLFQSSVWNAR